ncbi:MAG: Na/Pi cotransporter family protein [Peptococcaceae bacterium]|jgi:phosphate:Na+ symporter|nr:Na/Pi cotransporter family protein [Peptococcaceae bacterium]
MRDFIFGLLGGTALLMFGISLMGDSLQKLSGKMMRKVLGAITGNVFKAFLVGTLVTSIVQSSTAVTVLTVGFVNARLMQLSQAVGIIYGANIGTTMTAQLMSLSFNFNLMDMALPIVAVGFVLNHFAKKEAMKHVGNAILGVGLLFLGIRTLNMGADFMRTNAALNLFFREYASIPVVGLFLGIMVTALVHSSSATVGLVMVLGMTGLIDFNTGVCIILGDNIGTSVTAQLASLTGSVYARRAAWAHTLYNIFGVCVIWVIRPYFVQMVESFTFFINPNAGLEALIANAHTLFNVWGAIVFLPLTKYYVRFLEWIIKDKKSKSEESEDPAAVLDKLLLDTPVAAIRASKKSMASGAKIAKTMTEISLKMICDQDFSKAAFVDQHEDELNALQKEVTRYVVELSKRHMTGSSSAMIPAMITCMNHIERIGDHNKDLKHFADVRYERGLEFSDMAVRDMRALGDKIVEMLDLLWQVLNNGGSDNSALLDRLRDMENDVDIHAERSVQDHIDRLEAGLCTVEAGVLFLDMVNYVERISDHVYKASRDLGAGESVSAKK